MDILQSVALGIIEGITEFIPVSSTGHLILASDILKIQQTSFVKDFEIVIQLGAILAIVTLYLNTFLKNSEVWKRVVVAFIPTAAIGFLLFKFIKNFLIGNTFVTILALFIGGITLIIIEKVYKEKAENVEKIEDMSFRNAFIIGAAQSLAVIPGVSRSAATIVSAIILGTKRKTATEFSFLLAVPTLAAATGLDLIKSNFSYNINEWLIMIVGFVSAFISALIVVKWFLRYVQNHTFVAFGIYRIVIAIVFWYILIK